MSGLFCIKDKAIVITGGSGVLCGTMARELARLGAKICIVGCDAFRPLTNVAAYSATKAAVSNFTQWLAIYMCWNYSKNIRINAIAPGFFLTEQNRYQTNGVAKSALN
jgi:NAD(P)-dependent dehydrogenase (short-subunit alcohol dehydrogenase family)